MLPYKLISSVIQKVVTFCVIKSFVQLRVNMYSFQAVDLLHQLLGCWLRPIAAEPKIVHWNGTQSTTGKYSTIAMISRHQAAIWSIHHLANGFPYMGLVGACSIEYLALICGDSNTGLCNLGLSFGIIYVELLPMPLLLNSLDFEIPIMYTYMHKQYSTYRITGDTLCIYSLCSTFVHISFWPGNEIC